MLTNDTLLESSQPAGSRRKVTMKRKSLQNTLDHRISCGEYDAPRNVGGFTGQRRPPTLGIVKTLLSLLLSLLMGAPTQAAEKDAPPIKDGKAVKLACVGDSITGGFGVTKGMSWPDQIAKMLGSTYEVGNFGLGGTYLLAYQRTDYYQNAIRFNPDVVVIMLGTNDVRPLAWKNSKPNFVTNYLAMIKQLSELPSKPRVFICYPPTITEPDGSEDNILELIPLMDEVAKRTKVGIIDIHGAFKGKGELIPDKIHPNDAGQTIIATTIYKALTGDAPAGN